MEPIADAFKLPTEPYPGLRPFLDYEAALLLGRTRQVREVIARLRETRFVAVIGGSGSGKSSLIRAGVVPELRGFGIPDAGDYWVPVTWTPGTTTAPVRAARHAEIDATRAAQTPITRLAWKFSQQLEPADAVLRRHGATDPIDGAVEAARRRAEIAAVFGQGSGFSRLVDAYFDELPALGPQRENARFLFVIDQFEELFHPNNHANEDAKLLVEAVIDHFFNPHPRCFVILTMRSEHLADCAGFLELPDAINKSSYLVRRLDNAELREAIVGPAQYFLRLLQRGRAGGALPDDVVFDEPVIARLLADVHSITSDADHLPLLQHVLARLWEAARQREAHSHGRQVPAQIVWADLEHAVAPRGVRAAGWLHEPARPPEGRITESAARRDPNEPARPPGATKGPFQAEGRMPESAARMLPNAQSTINTLRSSLENWAQSVYLDRSPDERLLLDNVLRQLAFKDPNNGQYSQQRVDVDDPRLLAGVAQPRQLLRDLLEHGFLDSVNYLFWDKENPDRVTLKVSHESFIRGWAHFRALVDAEADRFEEFVAVLRKCALWKADQSSELLLEASELMRLDAARLDAVFEHPDERRDWFRVLLQYRDGERLARVEPNVDGFLAASRAQRATDERSLVDAAERERESMQRARDAEAETARADAVRKRNFWLGMTALIVAFLLLPYAAFAIFVQNPVMKSVEKFATARALVERRERSESNPVAGAAARELGVLLDAAALIAQAETEVGFFKRRGIRDGLVDYFPPVAGAKRLFAMSSSEPLVNGNLRALLTTALWRNTTVAGQVDPALVTQPERHELDCIVTLAGGGVRPVRGSLFRDSGSGRGVFIPVQDTGDTEIALFAASFTDGRCTAGRSIWSVPHYLGPLLLFDANLRYMAVALDASAAGQLSVSLYTIGWESAVEGRPRGAQVKFRSVVADANAVALVRSEVNPLEATDVSVPEAKSVVAWREPGGVGVAVAGSSWRLFNEGAQRIRAPGPERDWVRLAEPAPASGCARLGGVLGARVQPGFTSQMLHDGERCFEIQRGNPPPTGLRDAAAVETPPDVADAAPAAQPATGPTPEPIAGSRAAPSREQVFVAVYEQPRPEAFDQLSMAPPAPIASIVPFGRFRPNPGEWIIATNGDYAGWIALRTTAADGSERYFGAPWSTAALARLGRQVHALAANPAPLPPSAPARSPAHMPPASSPPPR